METSSTVAINQFQKCIARGKYTGAWGKPNPMPMMNRNHLSFSIKSTGGRGQINRSFSKSSTAPNFLQHCSGSNNCKSIASQQLCQDQIESVERARG